MIIMNIWEMMMGLQLQYEMDMLDNPFGLMAFGILIFQGDLR